MPAVLVTPDELHVRLVARIREIARRRGLGMEPLAAKAGVSQRHLWSVLSGRHTPKIDFVAKLAAALEVDPVELFRPQRRPRAGA